MGFSGLLNLDVAMSSNAREACGAGCVACTRLVLLVDRWHNNARHVVRQLVRLQTEGVKWEVL